jgi:hypothetical protein
MHTTHYLDVCAQYVQQAADPTHVIPTDHLLPMPPLKKLRGTKPDAQDRWAGEKIPKLFYAWAESQEDAIIKTYVASAKTGDKEESAKRAKVCNKECTIELV